MKKKYPLEQLVFIKKKKLEEAERQLRKTRETLKKEEEKYKEVKSLRDKAKEHKDQKLAQLREALDEGLRTDKLEQMRLYLKIVEEKLQVEEKKVIEQKKVVKKAEDEVEKARQAMLQKQRDIEKLREHKKTWTTQELKELAKEEAKEEGEMGTVRFIKAKAERKKKGR